MGNKYRQQEPEPQQPMQALQYEGTAESFIGLLKFAPKALLKRDVQGIVRLMPDKLLSEAEPQILNAGDYLIKVSEEEVYTCTAEEFLKLAELEPPDDFAKTPQFEPPKDPYSTNFDGFQHP